MAKLLDSGNRVTAYTLREAADKSGLFHVDRNLYLMDVFGEDVSLAYSFGQSTECCRA